MLIRIALMLVLLFPLHAVAADPAPAKPAAKPAAAPAKSQASSAAKTAEASTGKSADSLSTNVVGSQEAPTVLNVVPWKDKEVKLEKKNPTSNILNNVLQPLDRDVLRREVQYFRSLQESTQ